MLINPLVLSSLFFLVALLYSIVGFGGGSSYIAIMALLGMPYEMIPPLALLCNIIVVSGGTYHFVRQGHFVWPYFWPLIISSVPMAFLGGRIPISRETFLLLLGICLLIAGIRLILRYATSENNYEIKPYSQKGAFVIGGGLGFISGMIGIGGGIFLAPLLLNLGWAKPKQVAALASAFILANSLSGLTGQLVKQGGVGAVSAYWPIFLAVLIGGQIGSVLGSGRISQKWVGLGTALLVLFVSLRILYMNWL